MTTVWITPDAEIYREIEDLSLVRSIIIDDVLYVINDVIYDLDLDRKTIYLSKRV